MLARGAVETAPLAKMIWDADILFPFGVGILLGWQAGGFSDTMVQPVCRLRL